MKKLANKLFKLKTRGLLVDFVKGEECPQTRDEFETFIRANLQSHADYMHFHSTKVFKKSPASQIAKWRNNGRARLREWLEAMRKGELNTLYTSVRTRNGFYTGTKKYNQTIGPF